MLNFKAILGILLGALAGGLAGYFYGFEGIALVVLGQVAVIIPIAGIK